MNQQQNGKVAKISGPLVLGTGLEGAKMHELVRVGKDHLFGEIIEIKSGFYSIQVYEETAGLTPGDPVAPTGMPLSVELGPGLISSIYDGVQRPLVKLRQEFGDWIVRGADLPALDRTKKWKFEPVVKPGDRVVVGDILGKVQETPPVVHYIMVPPDVGGEVLAIQAKECTIEEPVAVIRNDYGEELPVTMLQRWPVRTPRPVKRRLNPTQPLVTGQRILDMLFPLAKGGTACVPGPFGSGKTVVQHQLAKWADADIVVYVGCGERGNEMTDVLLEFPELLDPRTNRPLIERTVLVANTSNMPVAAREASIFTGITMAEYYRDMGYNVALMADSTSRWAEAMREISGRLGEMPGEEGYPTYITSRIASFYERGGLSEVTGSGERTGSVSMIGAVSPPGGDLSDPVVQATLRVVRVFWGLDDRLAAQRHFPAINWLTSYSLYQQRVDSFADRHVDPQWRTNRVEAMALLQRESELEEIVRLVGLDALSVGDRLIMQSARMIREDFLHQNAFHEVDTYTSLPKQFHMLDVILTFHHEAGKVLEKDVIFDELLKLTVLEKIARAKLIEEPRGGGVAASAEEKEKTASRMVADIARSFQSLKEEVIRDVRGLIKEEEEPWEPGQPKIRQRRTQSVSDSNGKE